MCNCSTCVSDGKSHPYVWFYIATNITGTLWYTAYRANYDENINDVPILQIFPKAKEILLILFSIIILVSEESPRNGVPGDDSIFEDTRAFPPPPPPTEISLLELPPKTPPSAEAFQINELDIWPSVQAAADVEQQSNGAFSSSCTPSPQSAASMKEIPSQLGEAALPPSPSPAKEAPPVPTKPKPRL